MKRLTDEMVPLGLRIAWRRASWPTRRSPWSVKATTDGVVLDPSALGITVGFPASTTAMTELVVPRSMPTALAIATSRLWLGPIPRCAAAPGSAGDLDPARLCGLGLGHPDGQHAVRELRAHLVGLDVAWQVGVELELAGPPRAAVPPALRGV